MAMAQVSGADERTPLLQSGSTPTKWRRPKEIGVRGASPADFVISVFEPARGGKISNAGKRPVRATLMQVNDIPFFRMVVEVERSIEEGVQPRMISVGTSGSYFVYVKDGGSTRIAGVFKPMDEEPYGNLKYVLF